MIHELAHFVGPQHRRAKPAGIRSLIRKAEGADLSRPAPAPGEIIPGMVGDIISERWARSSRNWVGGFIPERRAASAGIGTLAVAASAIIPALSVGRSRIDLSCC